MARVSLIIFGSQASVATSLTTLSQHKTIQVVGCHHDLIHVFRKLSETEPSIILMDFSLMNEANYSILTELRRSHPNTKVIFLCDRFDETRLIHAFHHGASGFIEAKNCETFLAKAIQATHDGEAWVPRQFASKIVETLARS